MTAASVQSSGNNFSAPFENAYKTISPYIQQAEALYHQAEDRLITILEGALPTKMHHVAQKVARAVPETLFCASMITGAMTFAAAVFGFAKLTWAAMPIFKSALDGKFDGDSMRKAAQNAVDRLKEINNSFRPAMFIACAVGAVASTTLGALYLSPSLVMAGAFLSMVSYMALESIEKPNDVAPAAVDENQPNANPDAAEPVIVENTTSTATATEAPAATETPMTTTTPETPLT